MYVHDGHYVILFIYIGFFNSLAYIFSTLYTDPVKKYNYVLGFLFMEVSTLVVISLFRSSYDIVTMGNTKYYGVFFFWTIVNFYVSFDTYLILSCRGESYNESDYIYAYYALWCDWFSHFWLDLFSMMEGKKV